MGTIETDALSLTITRHAESTITSKGFDLNAVRDTFRKPKYCTNVLRYPGQIRLIGNGLALVGVIKETQFILITVYEDGTLTPPRSDQMATPEGQRFAERYARGLGRG